MIRICSTLFVAIAVSWALAGAEKNIVFVVADDHGQDMGCYGNPVLKTPHMDAVAKDGVRFKNAYCTTASCSASRSVLLSGIFNHRNRQYGHSHDYHHFTTDDKIRTLPVLLAQAGYRTARIGKLHVEPEKAYAFDTVLKGDPRNAVQMADACRDFIGAKDERPFFLYYCTSDPHRSDTFATEKPHAPDRFGNMKEGQTRPGVETIRYRPEDVVVPAWLPDSPASRAELAEYYESISRVDQGLGRLVQHLKDAGVYDKTLLVYISDHGAAFAGGKTSVYEPGLKSPCLVRNPYLEKRGLVSESLISWVDWTPTLLDFAGALKKDAAFHGRSFLPILSEEKAAGWDEIYASHTFHEITMYYPMRVIRSGRYKLIWNIAHQLPYPFASDLWASPTWQDALKRGPESLYGTRTIQRFLQRPRFELYDIEKDPFEAHDLSADTAHAETLKLLQEKLAAFQKRTEDPWILKWKYE